jgi:hypothetical protein
VLNFHEELLKRLGTDWKNPNPFAGSGYFEENREVIENSVGFLLDSLINSSITAVKEPRMSILLDIWESQISKRNLNLKSIITIRHPSEVAYSMKKRDNLNLISGLQLWAQATLNAIKFARDKSNLFLFYDQLLAEPLLVTSKISTFLEISKESQSLINLAASDVHQGARHHQVNIDEVTVLNITTEMYEHILKFDSSTALNFPDELLDQWQRRLQSIHSEVNRLQLISNTDSERDQVAADRDRITQELTAERDQVAADRDRITGERDALLDSTIWKITKPVRWTIRLFRG